MPTDTIYGLVGSALSKKTVTRIYFLKKRDLKKPLIILIPSISSLSLFGIELSKEEKNLLEDVWPGKVSVILPCLSKKFEYLHKGTKTLAFRVPDREFLVYMLKKTGPLVAPSANTEGKPPARNTTEAKKYFGKEVDFYLSGKSLLNKPSTLVRIKNGKFFVLRQGPGIVPKS